MWQELFVKFNYDMWKLDAEYPASALCCPRRDANLAGNFLISEEERAEDWNDHC